MNQPVIKQPDQKTLVFLVSGFLGSGKTTLLKRILSWQTKLSDSVVLVNEFGDVGIDGDLLKNSGSDVIELVSGCICCSLQNDLRQSLSHILKQYRPKRIFIEASGIADPTAVVSLLGESPLAETLKLEKIVTVLDADFWDARENFGRLFYNQLETANLILLNKIDLLDKISIPVYLKEIHDIFPRCQVIPTVRCCIDPETIWSGSVPIEIALKPINPFQQISKMNTSHCCEDHIDLLQSCDTAPSSHLFKTFSFVNSGIIDEAHFKHFLDTLPLEVFRMKGSVKFHNRTEIVNFVGGKGDWSKWEGKPETRLAFIGWNIDPAEILKKINRCIADP